MPSEFNFTRFQSEKSLPFIFKWGHLGMARINPLRQRKFIFKKEWKKWGRTRGDKMNAREKL